MNAYSKTELLALRMARRGINVTWAQANVLRRAEIILHRWAELECGDSDSSKSWAIERDENEIPHMVIHPHDGSQSRSYRIPDREAGAVRRVARVCKEAGLHYRTQSDPRGAVLFVSAEPIPENDIHRAFAIG